MKSKWIMVIVSIIFLAGLGVGAHAITQANAANIQPGSVEDPVVTKSYVDQQIEQGIKAAINNMQSGGGEAIAPNPQSNTSNTGIDTVVLKNGQVLYAGSGAEFIVRTGKVVAVTTIENGIENGIPDITAGEDILGGKSIGLNHLLVFPREGRGIKPAADNKGDIYVMVRGSYLLLNQDGSAVEQPAP